MTPSEIRLKKLLQLWMVLFLFATVIFIFFGNELLQTLNFFSERFTPFLVPIPMANELFWMTLTASLMITLVFLCYWGQQDLKRNSFVVVPILVSKFTSTFFFFVFFLFHLRSLAYFTGALVDGTIFLITFYMYRRFQRETRAHGF